MLYGLQDILVDIPYEKNAEGKYAAPENVSVYDVIERIVRFSNEYKQNNEIYGMNIECELDEELKNLNVPVVLYDNTKSVWDTLQAVANFAQCYIYANRTGRLVATCDIPYTSSAAAAAVTEDVYISPKNSFSYSMPLQSKCIVNRVVMPYSELIIEDSATSNISIKPEEMRAVQYTDDDGETKTKYIISKNIDNYYLSYDSITIRAYVNGNMIPIQDSEYILDLKLHNKIIYLILVGIEANQPIQITLNGNNLRYKIEDKEITYDSSDKTGIKVNGLCEFTADKSIFMVDKDSEHIQELSSKQAERILNKYQKGVTYTETEWIGSPKLRLNGQINCQSKYDSTASTYECFGNEFTLEEGLRVKSKLRKIESTAKS